MSKKSVVAELHILNSLKGHAKETITIKDDNPKKRAKLAEKITELIKDGYAIMLPDGRQIKGYDAEANEWLVPAEGKKKKQNLWDRVKIGRASCRERV